LPGQGWDCRIVVVVVDDEIGGGGGMVVVCSVVVVLVTGSELPQPAIKTVLPRSAMTVKSRSEGVVLVMA
jgi:hypothetical protein